MKSFKRILVLALAVAMCLTAFAISSSAAGEFNPNVNLLARYNENGDFELTFAIDSNVLEFMKEDYYLVSSESERTMIIEDITTDSDVEDGNILVVTGRSLESILERRIVWGQKVLTGNLQNGIKTLINEAIISPSDVNRKIDNFIFEESTDKRITDMTIDAQYFGEDLYSIIEGLCQEHEIGFKVILNDTYSDKESLELDVGIDVLSMIEISASSNTKEEK